MLRFDPFTDIDAITKSLLATRNRQQPKSTLHADGPLQDR